MKVIIITTKEEFPSEPPVEWAVKEVVQIWDEPQQRMLSEERWVAEVDNVFKLAIALNEELIVLPMELGETYPTIEIYNDYRE